MEFDEIVDPRCVEMRKKSADAGMETLTLLSLTTPFLQLIDAEARGFADDELKMDLLRRSKRYTPVALICAMTVQTRVGVSSSA